MSDDVAYHDRDKLPAQGKESLGRISRGRWVCLERGHAAGAWSTAICCLERSRYLAVPQNIVSHQYGEIVLCSAPTMKRAHHKMRTAAFEQSEKLHKEEEKVPRPVDVDHIEQATLVPMPELDPPAPPSRATLSAP